MLHIFGRNILFNVQLLTFFPISYLPHIWSFIEFGIIFHFYNLSLDLIFIYYGPLDNLFRYLPIHISIILFYIVQILKLRFQYYIFRHYHGLLVISCFQYIFELSVFFVDYFLSIFWISVLSNPENMFRKILVKTRRM